MLAQEMTAEVVASSGWFLDHAWLIPIIPAVAFVLIIFFGKKFFMRTDFSYSAFVHDNKAVCIAEGGKSVSNGEHGSTVDQIFDGFLNHAFGFGVYTCRGFIENEDLWVVKNGSGNRNSLPFSSA